MNKNSRSVFSNFIYNLSYQLLVFLTPLLTAPYASRILGPENIGAYSYTSSLVAYFVMFSALGLNMYGKREIAYSKGNIEQQSIRFYEITIFKLITVSLALIIYIPFSIIYTQYTCLLLIQSVTLLNVLFDITWFFQGQEDFKVVAIRNFVIKLSCVLSIFIFVRDKDDLYIYVIIHVLSVFAGNFLLWKNLVKQVCRVPVCKLRPFKDMRTYLELFFPVAATQVYNVLDKTMLGYMSTSSIENGYMEQAHKIINVILAVVNSLGPVLMPRVATAFANGSKEQLTDVVGKSFKYICLVCCPLCVGVWCISKAFVPWFFGEGYEKVVDLLRIYSLVLLVIPISNLAGHAVLNPTKQHNKGTIALWCGAVINFSTNLVLIPHFGSIGAAWATVFAETAVTVVYCCFINSAFSVHIIVRSWFKYLVLSVLMGIPTFYVGEVLVICGIQGVLISATQILIGVSLYFVLLILSKDKLVVEARNVFFNKLEKRNH